MSKTKLEIVSQMHAVEGRLDLLQEQRKAVSSAYLKGGTIRFKLNTTDFQSKGHEKAIPFDPELMTAYLTAEIDKLNTESDALLVELSELKR